MKTKTALGLLLLLQTQTAFSQTSLEKAESAFEAMDVEAAERLYKEALKGPGSLQERISTWKGLGVARAIMGNEKGARESFTRLLLLQPDATIDESMGPKISRPFQMAKKALAFKSNRLSVERAFDGEVRAVLKEDVPWAKKVVLHVQDGLGEWKTVEALSFETARVLTQPSNRALAWAVAFDENDGELYLEGSLESPLEFDSTGVHPAVASAQPESNVTVTQKAPFRAWPWVVSGAVAVAAAATVAIVVSQPQPLELPQAQRVSQLP